MKIKEEKKCTLCGEMKPLSEYYFIRKRNRYFSRCIECTRIESRLYQRRTYTKQAGVDRYAKRKARGKLHGFYLKMKSKHPLQFEARNIFHLAKLRGVLIKQPCEVCGNVKSDGHHDDYSKPLEVRWLCRVHHMELHRKTDNPVILEKLTHPHDVLKLLGKEEK